MLKNRSFIIRFLLALLAAMIFASLFCILVSILTEAKTLDMYGDPNLVMIIESEFGVEIHIIDKYGDEHIYVYSKVSLERLEKLKYEKYVNINTANVLELMSLPEIDENIAREIIKRRYWRGGFYEPEDLLMVPSISIKMWNRWKAIGWVIVVR